MPEGKRPCAFLFCYRNGKAHGFFDEKQQKPKKERRKAPKEKEREQSKSFLVVPENGRLKNPPRVG
ncbi:hypothetical protein JQM64_06875 [Fournierella massiliensis]|nr:hypothetical protein [Fournierella massiliensis]MCF2557242.1 hypothetical protein [Fournierella massiliensis]